MRWIAGFTGIATLLLNLSGCSNPTGQVSGKVTQGSQPVAAAELLFQAKQNTDEQYRGVSGGDGVYRLDYGARKGVSPGSYRVLISVYTQRDGKPLPAGEQGNVLKNSGQVLKKAYLFEPEIAAGNNTLLFDLTQDKLMK